MKPDYQFQFGGKLYLVLLPLVFIPGLGNRTALEITVDEEAQAYLVKEGCVGSVIEEIDTVPNEPTFIDHILTQQDLDANPELVENGLKVGDTIQKPATE